MSRYTKVSGVIVWCLIGKLLFKKTPDTFVSARNGPEFWPAMHAAADVNRGRSSFLWVHPPRPATDPPGVFRREGDLLGTPWLSHQILIT